MSGADPIKEPSVLFPAEIVAAAQAAERAFYPKGPFVSIILAQWALESGYGRYESGKNNFFGIKATPAQIAAGQATIRLTHETIGGVYRPMYQHFADYPDVAAGFAAHSALLCEPRMEWAYGDCWRAETSQAYAHALKEHYATGVPGHPYDVALIAIMDQNNLYQYDARVNPASVPSAPGGSGEKGKSDMFSFSTLFSLLADAPAAIGAAETVVSTVTADVAALEADPAVQKLIALLNTHFTATSTPGAAVVIEPKHAK